VRRGSEEKKNTRFAHRSNAMRPPCREEDARSRKSAPVRSKYRDISAYGRGGDSSRSSEIDDDYALARIVQKIYGLRDTYGSGVEVHGPSDNIISRRARDSVVRALRTETRVVLLLLLFEYTSRNIRRKRDVRPFFPFPELTGIGRPANFASGFWNA